VFDFTMKNRNTIETKFNAAFRIMLMLSVIAVPHSVLWADEADIFLGVADARAALFDSYAQVIRDNGIISQKGFKRLDTTWDSELERAKKLFVSARTKEDVYYALVALKNSMHNTHSAINVPDKLKPQDDSLSLPFKLALAGSAIHNPRAVVIQSKIPQVKRGFELIKYNDKDLPALQYEYLQWHDSNSPELLKFETVKWLTRRDAEDVPLPSTKPVEMSFYDLEAQTTVQVSLEWRKRPKPDVEQSSPCGINMENDGDYKEFKFDFAGLNYCVYKDPVSKTILLRYFSFYYYFPVMRLWNRTAFLSYKPQVLDTHSNYPAEHQLSQIDAAELRKYLARQKWRRLLIDVRENTGGGLPEELLKFIARKPFRMATRSFVYTPRMRGDVNIFDKATENLGPVKEFLAKDMENNKNAKESFRYQYSYDCPHKCTLADMMNAEKQPDIQIKKFDVAVLSGPLCVSSCDQFVSIFKYNDMGRVFGLPSRGGTMPSGMEEEFVLKNGDKFSVRLPTGIGYKPDGEALEGNPPIPDFFLFPQENYLRIMLDHMDK